MTIQPIDVPFVPGVDEPDSALPGRAVAPAAGAFAAMLSGVLDETRARLGRADAAETAFTRGHGSLQSMVIERAQADVALSLATAAASRATQALSTILGMQV